MKKQQSEKFEIHFVGIKGVGMTPLAIIAKEAGFTVTGSDVDQEFITDAALKNVGIVPLKGFSPEHIGSPGLVITTGAHGGFENIEVKTAREKNIRAISAGEALGEFMDGKLFDKKFQGISVAGTHGKTTTTAMIATILSENKLDPTYVIGTGDVGSLSAPGHFGKGKHFVAEADEYATEPKNDKKARLLWQHPQIAVLLNIEFDHPDIYNSVDEIREVFLQFARNLPAKGTLIAHGDDREVAKLLREYNKTVITYGFSPGNDYVIKRAHISGDQTFFWVDSMGATLGEFVLRVVGEHNALNALAATITCLQLGVPLEKIKKGLLAFQGSKRRLEFMGQLASGAKLYDDYAHHPTEIKKDLQALRQQYPQKKIVCVFQPHTYSRTKSLFSDFVRSFEHADTVIVTDIYASLREALDESVSAFMLSEEMRKQYKDVRYVASLDDVLQYINEKRFRADTILVTMGAGDVYTIHEKLTFV